MRSDLDLVHWLASEAAALALPFFGAGTRHEVKSDGTPVSEVDLLVERVVLDVLARERPFDGVLTEESGSHHHHQSNRRWIIDPLDMTAAFLADDPGWGFHVALEIDGRVEVAIITRPVLGMRWWAERGAGAFRSTADAPCDRSNRLSVSVQQTMASARVGGFASSGSTSRRRLTQAAIWVDGESCIVGALAEGRLDVFVDDGGQRWIKPPQP
jgi:histidinol-phosphatase